LPGVCAALDRLVERSCLRYALLECAEARLLAHEQAIALDDVLQARRGDFADQGVHVVGRTCAAGVVYITLT